MTGPEIVCAIGAAFLLLAICATVFAVIKGNAAIRDDDSGRSWKGFKSESKSFRRRGNWWPFGDISLLQRTS